VIVELTAADVAACADYARRRDGRHPLGTTRFGQGDDRSRQDHHIGVLGELAVARHYDLPWPTPDDVQSPYGDVGRLEVRATTRTNGRLILHGDDPPGRAYVLARVALLTNHCATVDLVGYYRPGWGLRAEWWEEHRYGGGCYYVPPRMLASMLVAS